MEHLDTVESFGSQGSDILFVERENDARVVAGMSYHGNAASLVNSRNYLRYRWVENPDAGSLPHGHELFLIRHNAFFQQQLI